MKSMIVGLFVFVLIGLAVKYLWPLIVLGFKLFFVLSVVSIIEIFVTIIILAGFFLLACR